MSDKRETRPVPFDFEKKTFDVSEFSQALNQPPEKAEESGPPKQSEGGSDKS